MIKKVDDLLIDFVFQPISDKCQMYSGKTCFFLARLCVFVCGNLWVYMQWQIGNFQSDAILLMVPMLMIQFYYIVPSNLKDIALIEDEVSKVTGKGYGNRLRSDLPVFRFAYIIVAFILIYVHMRLVRNAAIEYRILVVVAWTSWVCIYFFKACTPMPPSESKTKWWKRKIEEVVQLETSLEPIRIRA